MANAEGSRDKRASVSSRADAVGFWYSWGRSCTAYTIMLGWEQQWSQGTEGLCRMKDGG